MGGKGIAAYHTGFTRIVTTLLLWYVYRVARHARGKHTIPMSLLLEHKSSCSGTVICTVEIHRPNAIPVLELAIQASSLRGDPSVRNHNIETAKIGHHQLNGIGDFGVVFNGDFVDPDLNLEIFADDGCQFFCFIGGIVPECKLQKRLGCVGPGSKLSAWRSHICSGFS